MRANGKVEVNSDKVNCYGEKLCVRQNATGQIATMTGNTYILREGNKVFADKIVYNFDTEELTIKGNIHS